MRSDEVRNYLEDSEVFLDYVWKGYSGSHITVQAVWKVNLGGHKSTICILASSYGRRDFDVDIPFVVV